ncbi:MAG: tetratricopeptide repeat protein, partial [Treponema sp.]|nr:tetratricopeptide repeat protein [Treponema sp.]
MNNAPMPAGARARRPCRPLVPALCCVLLAWASCRSSPAPNASARPAEFPITSGHSVPAGGSGGGLVEEIRSHTERGTPSSLLYALEIIHSRNLGGSEFGRAMNFVNITLLRTLYPSIQANLPPVDPPLLNIYSHILREAERGIYTPPRPNSSDYLEFVLPFLAYYPGRNRNPDGSRRQGGAERPVPPERFLAVMPDLQAAAGKNRGSVLAGYFIGVVMEQTGRLDEASRQYSMLWEQFPEFFPAPLGIARIMKTRGNSREVVGFLSGLTSHFPGNLQVMRQLALAHYHAGDWARAETAVAEILQRNPRDADFVLMRAHILVEQGQFLRAQAPLDIYAAINPSNTLFLFLRARVQAEGFNNRDAALGYLRTILRNPPTPANRIVHDEASVYAVRLLFASPRPADQAEGRELLARLLAVPTPPLEAVALAL